MNGNQQTALSGSDIPATAMTIRSIGDLFPIKKKRSYLNNASIGPMSEPVLEAVEDFLHDVRDNGRNNYPYWCRHADTTIKNRIGRLIGASGDEIAFTKNTTEGLGFVANGLDWREGDNVVLPDIEYPSNVYCWMNLKKRGVEIRWVKNRDGYVPLDAIRDAITPRTRLISLSPVQFSNGFRQDLALISQLCAERGVLLNLDAIQWIGALRMDVSQHRINFMSAGGHKWLLAPIGTGFFYCNSESLNQLAPPTVGYHTVDKGEAHLDYELIYRPGAGRFEEALVNFPGIWGLDAAVKLQLAVGTMEIERHILDLTAYAADALQRLGCRIASPMSEQARSGLLSFTVPNADGEQIEARLRDEAVDIAVRDGRLRASPSFFNDAGDIDRLVSVIADSL
ncbi:aminotransferase class V-fold PLP-dependent enzyme [Pelagibius sp.]|uniref:aminotransferase class V-fold PLP-dependent enzyme n=1 Tax=Pelagibius sp. TaxID=1931238 RepID=UPI003BAE24C2